MLDPHRAYISGLLHDIGRFEGVRGLHHVCAGHELLCKKGYESIAKICLTHSFAYKKLAAFGGGVFDCTPGELSFIETFISDAVYDDYDKLVQLCDILGTAKGVCIMEVRLLDSTKRYGFNEFTLKNWESFFSLKDYFDKLSSQNIYDLFYDEIRDVSFGR